MTAARRRVGQRARPCLLAGSWFSPRSEGFSCVDPSIAGRPYYRAAVGAVSAVPNIADSNPSNRDFPGYLAVPDGAGPWPAVVVVQGVIGMTADLRRITDRFAASGYLSLAPALYSRGPKIRCMLSTMRAAINGHGSAHGFLVAARDHFVADERCTGKVGLVGSAWGHRFVCILRPTACSKRPLPITVSYPGTLRR